MYLNGLKLKKTLPFLLGSLVPTLIVTSPVYAQSSAIEEIVVTSQKREQSIQDVGIAITAFSGDQLEKSGIRDSTQLARLSPGVNIQETNGGATQNFSIRGVTQSDFNNQGEAPNAVYIDEGYLSFGNGSTFGIFDLERAEVLKGPQGTLFGRNATGGLVHFISRKPTQETDGYFDASFGSFDSFNAQGAIGGALSETVSARVAFLHNENGSIYNNQFAERNPGVTLIDGGGEDTGDSETNGVRAHLLIEPNENFSALISASYNRTDFSTPSYFSRATVPVLNEFGDQIDTIVASPTETRANIGPGGVGIGVRPVAGGSFFGAIACSEADINSQQTCNDFSFEDVNSSEAASLTANLSWDLNDNLTLTSISDYRDFDKELFLDTDGSNLTFFPVGDFAQIDSFAQELRLNGSTEKLQWVGGLYYLTIDNDAQFAVNFPSNSLFAFAAGTNDVLEHNTDTDSLSIFGQLEYELNSKLSLTAGLRVIREEKDFDTFEAFFVNQNGNFQPDTENLIAFNRPFTEFEQDDTLWSGKIQLDYRPNDNLLIYGGVNRGTKAGNFNSPITLGGPFNLEDIPYDDETLIAYEVGFKSDFAGGRVRLNGAAYHYDYQDYQVFVFINISNSIQNADATYTGGELELSATPFDGFDIGLNVAYIDAEVENVQLNATTNLDREPTFTPEVQASGVATYRFPTQIFGGSLTWRVDVSYSDDYFENITNRTTSNLESFTNVNTRLTWVNADENLELYVYGNNVTDELNRTTNTDVSDLFGIDEFAVAKPRWYGVGARYSF